MAKFKLKALSPGITDIARAAYCAHSKNIADIINATLASRAGWMTVSMPRSPGDPAPLPPSREESSAEALRHCRRDIIAGVNMYFLLTGAPTTEIEADEHDIGLTPDNRDEPAT